MAFKTYHPDFDSECRICGTSPCVIVAGHVQPHTYLCGPHFFADPQMIHWDDWNETDPSNEETDDEPEDTDQ